MDVREITSCRACGSANLRTVLDLGELCVSGFIAPGDVEERAPLELVVCLECTLVQLRHTVERDRLYREYWYRSGTNESMVAALRDVVEDACSRVKCGRDDAVVDIGANDGTMLRMFPEQFYRIGFEPAMNLYQPQRSDRIRMHNEYFPPELGPSRLWHYKIITSIAMFYDLEDPGAFVQAIADWLHPEGVWVVQFQDLAAMLACRGFDNICHEHLTYWSNGAFLRLLASHGLRVEQVSYNQTNGGSVRYIVRHGAPLALPASVENAFAYAFDLAEFGVQAALGKVETRELLRKLRAEGRTVLGYGASTKGNTLLQYYGLDREWLPAIAERNPEKWGKETVGSHIPIISEAEMRQRRPDYLLVLPWHFIDSFVERERDFLGRGGKFIVPLPRLRVIGGEDLCPSTADDHYAKASAATG